jgi:hypothetical protein
MEPIFVTLSDASSAALSFRPGQRGNMMVVRSRADDEPGSSQEASTPPAFGSAESGALTTPVDPKKSKRRRRDASAGGSGLFEGALSRILTVAGVLGIGVALGAILVSQHVQGWITGGVIAIVSLILSGLVWSPPRR